MIEPQRKILELEDRLGIGIERDLHFSADKALSEYAEEAYQFPKPIADLGWQS